MILVQNHRQRLNGNNLIAFVFILLLSASCGILNPEKGGKSAPPDSVPTQAEKTVSIYNPRTGQYEEVPASEVIIDTLSLRDITEISIPPITESDLSISGEKKSSYHFSLMMPFNAIKYQNISNPVDPRGRRFIQYYAGARLAVDDLMQSGIRIDMHVYDTEESSSKVRSLLNDPNVKSSDVIIGPYRTENIEAVSAFSKENQIVCVSPWIPGFEVPGNNPQLLQMTPGLEAHADAIFEHIEANYPRTVVYIVSRNSEREMNRLTMFKDAYQRIFSEPDSLKELMINDNTSDLQNTDWLSIFEKPERAIFVIPYYSRGDEGFVNSVLRKIHAERLEKEIIVFGMPQWMSFRNMNYDYLEALQAHLSTISYTDRYHHKYKNFSSRFFDRYGIVAEDPAFQGYDLISFLGKAISENGTMFLPKLKNELSSEINLGFDIRPVYENRSPDQSDLQVPKYFENRGIRILKFYNQDFQILK
jgi:ABC-type branched-subunit amino acid transport system substrate-binding protein